MAKRLALRIKAQRNLGAEARWVAVCEFWWSSPSSSIPLLSLSLDVMQQATNAILRGGTIMSPSVSAKTIAEQLAEKINAKLTYIPVEKPEEERQASEQAEMVKRNEEELEINDFSQEGKWWGKGSVSVVSIMSTSVTPP
uniref:Uncharacterized protein n=1 Tax=Hucho hucho TaxID=62062 RepID=A0A4W5Q2J8_9TELE